MQADSGWLPDVQEVKCRSVTSRDMEQLRRESGASSVGGGGGYYNTSEYDNTQQVYVTGGFEDDDEDMLEYGKEFQEDYKGIEFNFVQKHV